MYEINRKFTIASLKAGIVITLSLLLLLISVFFTGSISNLIKPKSTLILRFPNAQGLRAGAPVWIHGIEVGIVKEVKLSSAGVIIVVAFDRAPNRDLRADVSASIATMGILGDKFIEINPGEATARFAEKDTIQGLIVNGFEEVITTATSTMAQLDSTARNLTLLVEAIQNDNGTIGKLINDTTLYNNMTESFHAIALTLHRFQRSNGTLSRLIYDSTLYVQLSTTSTDLNYLINSMGNFVNNIEDGIQNGSIAGALLNETDLTDSIRQTISSYKNTAQAISELIHEIKTNPKKYFDLKLF